MGLSGRIWRGDPLIREYGDATVEVMILVGCKPTHMDTTLGHHIQGWVGASDVEKWSADGHGDTWWCVIVCWIVLWRGSTSHRIDYIRGETGAVACRMILDGIAIARGI